MQTNQGGKIQWQTNQKKILIVDLRYYMKTNPLATVEHMLEIARRLGYIREVVESYQTYRRVGYTVEQAAQRALADWEDE